MYIDKYSIDRELYIYIYIYIYIYLYSNHPEIALVHTSFSLNYETCFEMTRLHFCLSPITFYFYISYTKSFYKLYSNLKIFTVTNKLLLISLYNKKISQLGLPLIT